MGTELVFMVVLRIGGWYTGDLTCVDDGTTVKVIPITAASIIFRITRKLGRWKTKWVMTIEVIVPRGK